MLCSFESSGNEKQSFPGTLLSASSPRRLEGQFLISLAIPHAAWYNYLSLKVHPKTTTTAVVSSRTNTPKLPLPHLLPPLFRHHHIFSPTNFFSIHKRKTHCQLRRIKFSCSKFRVPPTPTESCSSTTTTTSSASASSSSTIWSLTHHRHHHHPQYDH